jgi:hypothetical protein
VNIDSGTRHLLAELIKVPDHLAQLDAQDGELRRVIYEGVQRVQRLLLAMPAVVLGLAEEGERFVRDAAALLDHVHPGQAILGCEVQEEGTVGEVCDCSISRSAVEQVEQWAERARRRGGVTG